jgi:glycosyltransferase involved in cell wall biosynthesis
MRPCNPSVRVPKILPSRLPLARCLIAFYVLIFLIFSSLLGLLVVPFPAALPSAHKRSVDTTNNNVGGGGDGGSRDIEWLMFQPNPVNQSTVSVCARIGGLAAVGGLETWFWTLQEYVLNSPGGRFRLHAVNLEALHWLEPSLDRFYYARSSVARIIESGLRLNIGPEEMIDECDVVLSSWVDPPLRPPSGGNIPRFKSVLIVHGSDVIEREGTWLYAHLLREYDATVCVSAGCMDAYGPSFQKDNKNLHEKKLAVAVEKEVLLHYIPSSIDLAKYDPTTDTTDAKNMFHLPVSKNQKILGFLGRIAEDKNPRLFVDVVSRLPKNWIGAMAGPLYLPEQMVSNLTSRIHLLGDVQEPWKFLAAVDALYVPSTKEGGPIVMLEAWAMGRPFFMRRTGLAVDHEGGVFVVPDDASAEVIAKLIDDTISKKIGEDAEFEKKIKYGLKTVKEQFSTDVLRQKYHNLMDGLLENDEKSNIETKQPTRLPFQVHYPKGQPPSEEAVQLTRRGRTLCGRCFYKQCLFYVKFNGLETKLIPSRKFTVVYRTFSAAVGSQQATEAAAAAVAGYLLGEKRTEKLATINASIMRQSVNINLNSNIFGVQLFDGQAIQIIDVLSAA